MFLFFILNLCISFSSITQAAESAEDTELLDSIQQRALDFFIMERDPRTGLVRDRANNFSRGATISAASIASVGFALTAYPVGVSRGWLDEASAREMTMTALRFFRDQAEHERGFYYHFLSMDTGKRASRSELSPIDTALLLAGVLFSAAYFEDDPEIQDAAKTIYERVDWPWMLHGGKTFAMSWSPENGFQRIRWDSYNESMIMYLLAIGSPTHPIPPESWHAIARPKGSYAGFRLIQMPPLFTHQYSHIWVDFRDKNDGHADYFQNSVNATKANRQFCIDQAGKFSTYGPDTWGLTASDGPFGYKAYGAPPGWAAHDGTVAPTACGGSIVFTPEESLACLRNLRENHEEIWGRYGFADAFNRDREWFSKDVIGIDQGTLILMIENYRSGMVWEIMKKNKALENAMQAVGFKPGTMELPWPEPPRHEAVYLPKGIMPDALLKDWPGGRPIVLNESARESGEIQSPKDLSAEIRFGWDEEALYFYAKVSDESLMARRAGRHIWQDDIVEIYIDPEGDGLRWGKESDMQLGFRMDKEGSTVSAWSWFGMGEDPVELNQAAAAGFADASGYLIEGAIRWNYLKFKPAPGAELALSVAVHDEDRDRSQAKMHWFFRNEEQVERFVLGRVALTGGPEAA